MSWGSRNAQITTPPFEPQLLGTTHSDIQNTKERERTTKKIHLDATMRQSHFIFALFGPPGNAGERKSRLPFYCKLLYIHYSRFLYVLLRFLAFTGFLVHWQNVAVVPRKGDIISMAIFLSTSIVVFQVRIGRCRQQDTRWLLYTYVLSRLIGVQLFLKLLSHF